MRRVRVFPIAASVAVLIASAIGLWLGQRLYIRVIPPAVGEAHAGEEEASLESLARRLSGRIIWSSTRFGDHEIVSARLEDGRVKMERLTNHPHVDTYPRFSADGKQILFNRSRERWASFRDQEKWDVWIMNADGSEQRRVAEVGFHASFTPHGRAVVFSRRDDVIRRSLDDGREWVLIDGDRELGGRPQEAEVREGGHVSITVRGRRRAFGVFDLGTRKFHEMEGDSCQISWWPGGDRLVWVEGHRGKGGNHILWSRFGGRPEVLVDLPFAHSHEYFPRPSRDGSWLVWAATASGHEHDRADYEIFAWRVGEPWSTATRLTHHTGNDQWPDVRLESR